MQSRHRPFGVRAGRWRASLFSRRYTAALVNPPSVKSTVEELDDNKVKLSVEVDEATFEVALDEAFKKISKEVRIPGFRQGKVPRRVLEANIGTDYARAEAIQTAMGDYYGAALRDHQVDAIAQPEIDLTGGESEGPITFDAVVETRPLYEVSGYTDIEVKIPNPVPGDELIHEQINMIRGRSAELVDVQRAATSGDTVTIDIVGQVDGEPLPGLTAQDYSYEVGSGGVGPELDEQLEGANAGDELEFTAEHPVDEDTSINFAVSVHAVKEKELPELTDEWVDENTEYESVDGMRSQLTNRMTDSFRDRASQALREAAAAAVGELVEADIPESLVSAEMNDQIQNLAYSLQAQGLSMDQWLAFNGKSQEEFAGDLEAGSKTSAKVDLALRAIAVAEGLAPADDDIEEELDRIADQLNETVEEIRDRLEHNDGLMSLRADLSKRAALEWMVERVAIVDEETGDPIDRAALEKPQSEIEFVTAVPTGTTDDPEAVDDGGEAEESDE